MVVVHLLAAVDTVERDEGDSERTVETLLRQPRHLPLQPGLLLAVVVNYVHLEEHLERKYNISLTIFTFSEQQMQQNPQNLEQVLGYIESDRP